ncbi:hypothetical protein C5O00_07205 [Pukyongia salina]|uniref:Uncharacterized protein n=1 Tax=Pukyongia salina TaxID=2094025 RepID=A0A2S0HXS0_9FLAO|nr:hypothetical protein C5O00_07205 [Pukyongia salina]
MSSEELVVNKKHIIKIKVRAQPCKSSVQNMRRKLRDSGAKRREVFERFLLKAKNSSAKCPFFCFVFFRHVKKLKKTIKAMVKST